MSYTPFLIANPRVGVERDIEPWLLPDQAFPDLEDCYLWRGRIKKRKGYKLLGRLNRKIATITSGTSTVSFTLLNHPLTAGNASFLVGSITLMDNGSGGFTQTDGGVTSTINYTTGAVVINLAANVGVNTDVFYYPSLPVMGLRTLEATTINNEGLIAFDTSFSYLWNGSNFEDISFYKTSLAPFQWTGTNYQLFWTENYADAMWATNNNRGFHALTITNITSAASAVITFTGGDIFSNGDVVGITNVSSTGAFVINGLSGTVTAHAAGSVTLNINTASGFTYVSGGKLHSLTNSISAAGDGIRWLDQDKSGWVNFLPPVDSTNFLMGALMLIPYKGTIIALNTIEGSAYNTTNNYSQRARWFGPLLGTPYYTTPVAANYQGGANPNAWRSDIAGNGGFIDATTNEQIVSAGFVKDTLIVYFERSTWQLRFTGNSSLPFVWEKINTELGAESTFSVVPFDKTTIAIGNVGIHACDSINVERIDQRIPDEVFSIENQNNGPQRVYGIRDYYNQLVYWSVPYRGINTEVEVDPGQVVTFPNKLLVYNYVDGSYSFFNDSFTCFGYFQPSDDVTWGANLDEWQAANYLWVTAQDNALMLNTIGGNQQGFVEILSQSTSNDSSLFISNISGSTITSPNHNLTEGQFIKLISASGISSGVGSIFKILSTTQNTLTINGVLTGTFTGSGKFSIVSNISILTKKFNPFISEGAQCRLGYVDFYVDKTTNGQVTVDLYINEDSSVPINYTNDILSTYPESTYSISPDTSLVNAKLWKRLYFEDISQLFQFKIYMDDQQMVVDNIIESDFALHGLILWFSKSGRLIDV